ncbi:MAG TPA: PqqD family protein [Thermoanaerobaculia bacterium]|nr:PqqD family protein [Thermoanaerobaculia bacterium]
MSGGVADRRVAVAPGVVFRVVDGEAVLLDLDNQFYFTLDAVGTRMWSLLAEDGSLAAARRQLLTELDVTAETLARDLDALVDELLAKGLLVEVAAGG